jgi:hypothetical protein
MPSGSDAGAAATPVGRSVWVTRRAVIAHIALAVWIPGCAVAAWWQVGIALGGDALGWVYSVMWPCFAMFGVVFWWFLVHDDPDRLGARGVRRQRAAAAAAAAAVSAREAHDVDGGPFPRVSRPDEGLRLARAEAEDPELAEYNAYLAALADREKSWRLK